MTNTQLKSQIDTQITNETEDFGITQQEVGNNLKALVDYIDQEVASVNQEVASVNQEVASVNQEVASVNQEVASVNQEVASVNQNLSSLSSSKENITNKSSNIDIDASSNTKYPSVKAVIDYIEYTVLTRLEVLEIQAAATALITAVFVPQGAMIAWNKPANTIPAGWQEVVDFKGKTLVGKDDSGVFATLGANVGSKDAVVVEHNHGFSIVAGFDNGGGSVTTGDGSQPGGINNMLPAGESGTDKNIQPSRIVHFIEYVGI